MSSNALRTYNKKRDFSITSEPAGEVSAAKAEGRIFVVQKHDATRLHYDFRLELDGVLLSWAIPKGPSYDPADKRLAARTEDHPFSYRDYEGIIPAHQYGAGPVMVWDTGTWEPVDENPSKALEDGKLTFRLHGDKMKGEWTLARMHKTRDRRENWLLIKRKDKFAGANADFLKDTDYSVKTGRPFAEIAQGVKGSGPRKAARPAHSPSIDALHKKYKGVQLATLVDSPPDGEDWVHEVKYDGYRILAFSSGGDVRIFTRNGHDWTDKFRGLAAAITQLPGNFIIDGEAVVLDEAGISDFKALQNALGEADETAQISAYFFDLLYRDGTGYMMQPFKERRAALEDLFREVPAGVLSLSETLPGDAARILHKACGLGLEGLISKNVSAPYSMRRSKTWLKSKCIKRQEFVVAGFVPASDRPKSVGALHLGYYKDGILTYAGKVGTGFDNKTAASLYKELRPLEAPEPPFAKAPDGNHRGTIWLTPQKVCEVAFAMWTPGGKIRHAAFQAMRGDKSPDDIVREMPEHKDDAVRDADNASRKQTMQDEIAPLGIAITHAEREIFPDAHVTKGDLAAFYAAMAEEMMATLKNRPVSVVRCPGGIDQQCFFQRAKGKGMPRDIKGISLDHDGKTHEYMYVDNAKGIVELVQMGCIEIHPWGSRIDMIEKPDRIIFDLDPSPGVPFEAVKLGALDVRARLEAIGLQCFVKTTGGKGLHVTAPILRRYDWDTVKAFTRAFAQAMADSVPEAYTLALAKSKRGNRIFIDYLRNDYAATAVVDYCVRARPGAHVAVPLSWDELDSPTRRPPSPWPMCSRARRKTGSIAFPPYGKA